MSREDKSWLAALVVFLATFAYFIAWTFLGADVHETTEDPEGCLIVTHDSNAMFGPDSKTVKRYCEVTR